VQAELAPVAAGIGDGEEVTLRQREDSAIRGISGVGSVVAGDEGVVRIVSTKKEQTDEAFGIVPRWHALGGEGGVEKAQGAEGGEDTGHAKAGAGGLAEEAPSGNRFGFL